jgi:hypothetical protein
MTSPSALQGRATATGTRIGRTLPVGLDPAVRGEDEEIEAPPNSNVRAAQLKCSLDELVVGRDPAVGGEDHELEAGAKHLAIR